MSKREDYEKKAQELILPILEENALSLVDIEYVKEGSDWYLRAYIDKEGGVTIDDCEKVSRAFSPLLDQEDFIEDAYIMEISSPGLGRPFKKPADYERHLEKSIEVHTFKPIDGEKQFFGILKSYNKDSFVIETEEKEMTFLMKEVSLVREEIEW